MSRAVISAEELPSLEQEPGFDEFRYRPVTPAAPITLVLGLCSFLGLFVLLGLVIGLAGTILGVICIRMIRKADGEIGGKIPAWIGTVLSALFFVGGIAMHTHAYATEVPEGYIRVNFPQDISKKEFVIEQGERKIHPDVEPLVEQKVHLKGYMYNTEKMSGIGGFILLKDNGECCFGGEPAPQDMIKVNMVGDRTTDYRAGLLAVAGVLHANPDAGPSEPVYTIDATLCEAARTSF